MVAGYHGTNVTQEQIAALLPPPAPGGALTIDLLDGARQLGFWSRQYRGDLNDLRGKLAAGIPLIVRGELGRNEHFFVVIGYDADRQVVIVHTDQRARHEWRREDFVRFWDRGGRWALVVCPPARATWKLSTDEHNDLGVWLEKAGQLNEAADHYGAAGNDFNLGNIHLKQHRYAEAAALFRKLPGNPDALNNLAWTYHEMGDHLDEAVAICRRAVQLRPPDRAYYLDTLGSVLLKQGKPAEAIAAWESALQATTDRQEKLRQAIRQRLDAVR
jgi:tetratricopeptide (TPR) repeat protein